MANITAQDINQLRKQTGVGLMDCKQALIEADGDVNKAIDILRKKGQKIANKRADKEANEGIAIARTSLDSTFGVIFQLTCETDFVAKGDDFVQATDNIITTALSNKVKTAEELMTCKLSNGEATVGDLINDLLGKIQEKIEIINYQTFEAPFITIYNHHNRKVSTLVTFNKIVNGIAEAGKDIAMQIAAMAPVAIDEKSVSNEVIEKELEIARELVRQEGKPEDMVERIAQGKLGKFFKESTLLNQQYIKDTNMTVKAYLESVNKELEVTSFRRLSFS